MNSYFTYTLCFGYGYTWQQALALTFLAGLELVVFFSQQMPRLQMLSRGIKRVKLTTFL